jgi:hypothetical protein
MCTHIYNFFHRDDINTSSSKDRNARGYEKMHIGYKNVSAKINTAFQRAVDPRTDMAQIITFASELSKVGLDYKEAFGCLFVSKLFFQRYIKEYAIVDVKGVTYLKPVDIPLAETKPSHMNRGMFVFFYHYCTFFTYAFLAGSY